MLHVWQRSNSSQTPYCIHVLASHPSFMSCLHAQLQSVSSPSPPFPCPETMQVQMFESRQTSEPPCGKTQRVAVSLGVAQRGEAQPRHKQTPVVSASYLASSHEKLKLSQGQQGIYCKLTAVVQGISSTSTRPVTHSHGTKPLQALHDPRHRHRHTNRRHCRPRSHGTPGRRAAQEAPLAD